MGLFDWIFRPNEAKKSDQALEQAYTMFRTLTAYQPVFTNWGGAIYESEVVRAAIDARARHISKLKVEIIGSANKSLQTKLRQGPNQWQTWSQFLYRVSTILDIHNTAFIVPVFDERMIITGIYPVLPTRCSLIDYKGELWLRYQFSSGDIGAVEFRKCALLTKYQYKNDFFGESNVALNDTMKLIGIQNQGIEEGVKSAATYRFWAQVNNFSKTEDLAKERKRFSEENFSKDAEGGGLLLFPNTYTNINQVKADPFVASADEMKLIKENVYQYFMVNEDVLTNKAYGDAWSAFYESAVEPFAIQFSEVMTRMLFTFREQSQGNHVTATANRIQYMSNADKLNVSAQMADRGLMTRNEIREIWNLPPLPAPYGDQLPVRGEYYNIGDDANEEQNDETGT